MRLLDVRSPEEHRTLGHIPGSVLLPLDLIPCAPATLPVEGPPILVYCEHGIRSVAAAGFLARAGFQGVLNLAGGLSVWTGAREFTAGDLFGPAGPSSWLVENADLLPRGGEALDLACGSGRHALLLAASGYLVTAVDRNPEKIERLREMARRLELPIRVKAIDLESGTDHLNAEAYDLVVGIHYLHRPHFPELVRALRPAGILVYETFTIEQAKRGKPTNPDFLLRPGELKRLAAPLEILREREGEFEGRMVAGVVARKPE